MRPPRLAVVAALAALAFAAAGCSSDDDAPFDPTPASSPPAARAVVPSVSPSVSPSVRSWAYQLQGEDGDTLDLAPLAASTFQLFVIDYSRDGSDEGAFSHAELTALQAGGRTVLAYLSIGEAESYRYYWDAEWESEPPSWLGPTNPAWEGNYKVRYWDGAWQEIVDGYLDRVVDAGFDGVYLDIIDAYEFFGPDGEMPEREDAAVQMLNLVARIAERARAERPGFLVFPQNGSGILDALTPAARELYLRTVDGIGAEDSFYFGDGDEDNPLDVQAETVELLREFRDAGRLVLAVDYLTDEAKIADFCARARNEGFVPLVTVRALDRAPEACPAE